MKVTVLTSSKNHPIYPLLESWAGGRGAVLTTDLEDAAGGDILFLISCSQIVNSQIRDLYKHSLVVHASDLPQGRGWSPHIWQILEGKSNITVTLLEAEDKVDTGAIWAQRTIAFEGHELYDEINHALFDATLSLMDEALESHQSIVAKPQTGTGTSYYDKRSPEDSRIEVSKSIEEQFNVLRVADSERFPAYFDHKGHRYKIKIEKVKE